MKLEKERTVDPIEMKGRYYLGGYSRRKNNGTVQQVHPTKLPIVVGVHM
jgi:hypothetical protein